MKIVKHLSDHVFALAKSLLAVDREEVAQAIKCLEKARQEGRFVWLMGNGGSAATASHFANDLSKACGLRAIALGDMVSTMLAFGNDHGWEKMFSDMLKAYVAHGDVIVIFSCSGRSENVLEVSRSFPGHSLIVFTGDGKDNLLAMNDATDAKIISGGDIMIQETVHLAMCHAIVDVLKEVKS